MVDLLCMGEPMLEFNQLPTRPDGSRHYLEGHGGGTSNAAIAAARQGARAGYITALGLDMPGDSFMALWAREGVDASTVIRTDRWLTGVYFVTHDVQGHHFLHYRANSAAAMFTAADLPEPAIARIKEWGKRIILVQNGMTPKNEASIRQASDPARELKLMELPDVLMRSARQLRPTVPLMIR